MLFGNGAKPPNGFGALFMAAPPIADKMISPCWFVASSSSLPVSTAQSPLGLIPYLFLLEIKRISRRRRHVVGWCVVSFCIWVEFS
jgi:hypothetical protein